MPLIKNRYGKGRVRVMRIHRDGERHEVSQLNVKAMIEGDFAPRLYAWRQFDLGLAPTPSRTSSTSSRGKIPALCTEEFCQVLAQKYLTPIRRSTPSAVTAHETKWSRLSFGGKPHPHSFVLDSNGKPTVDVTAARGARRAVVRHRGFYFHEIDPVGLGELRQGRLHHDPARPPTGCARPAWWRRGNGREAAKLSGDQRQDPRHRAGSVRHDLQQERAGQPLPDGRSGAGGSAGDFRDQHGLPEHALSSRSTCRRSGSTTTTTCSCRPTSRTARSNARWGGGRSPLSHRHCERSEAIHLASQRKNGLPRRCAPRNDGGEIRALYSPNFSCSAGHSRSGLNGVAVKRMPVASASALPSAAATGL